MTIGGEEASPPRRAMAEEPAFTRTGLALTLLGTGAMGFVLGAVAAFLVPAGPRVGSVLLSYGVVLALVGVPALTAFTCWASGERLAGLGPLTGFILAATLASSPQGEQIVLPNAPAAPDYLATYLFLLGGTLAGAAALGLVPRRWQSRRRPAADRPPAAEAQPQPSVGR